MKQLKLLIVMYYYLIYSCGQGEERFLAEADVANKSDVSFHESICYSTLALPR